MNWPYFVYKKRIAYYCLTIIFDKELLNTYRYCWNMIWVK